MRVRLWFPQGFQLACNSLGKFEMPGTTPKWFDAHLTAVQLNALPFPNQSSAVWAAVNQCGATVIGMTL